MCDSTMIHPATAVPALGASFVGVDLHKSTVTLVAVDAGGQELAVLTCHTKCVERIEAWLNPDISR